MLGVHFSPNPPEECLKTFCESEMMMMIYVRNTKEIHHRGKSVSKIFKIEISVINEAWKTNKKHSGGEAGTCGLPAV